MAQRRDTQTPISNNSTAILIVHLFRTEEFNKLMSEAGVRVTYAAPRHQEQNGICESNWQKH
jgi:hypothetical protein